MSQTPPSATPARSHWQYWQPKHWPFWLLVLCLKLTSKLPLATQWRLGRGLGWLFSLSGIRARVLETNINIAFPQASTKEKKRYRQQVYQHAGCWLLEMGNCWFQPPAWWLAHTQLHGHEHLAAAQAQGGVLLIMPHFSNLEFMGAVMTQQVPLHITYAPARYSLFNSLQDQQRLRYGASTIARDAIRSVPKTLRQGGVVWYSPDQSARREHGGVETTFFNHPVLSVSGTSRLAKAGRARVVPCYARRDFGSNRLHITFLPALENYPSDDSQLDTQRINDLFESFIQQAPEQYFWLHKRFKPMSPEHPNPYD